MNAATCACGRPSTTERRTCTDCDRDLRERALNAVQTGDATRYIEATRSFDPDRIPVGHLEKHVEAVHNLMRSRGQNDPEESAVLMVALGAVYTACVDLQMDPRLRRWIEQCVPVAARAYLEHLGLPTKVKLDSIE